VGVNSSEPWKASGEGVFCCRVVVVVYEGIVAVEEVVSSNSWFAVVVVVVVVGRLKNESKEAEESVVAGEAGSSKNDFSRT